MNIKRSYLQLLCASAGVGLFLANCTVKESSGDTCTKGDKTSCQCPGVVGHQVCGDDGTYGACICPGTDGTSGSSNSGGGESSTAGKTSGGTAGKTSSTEGGAGSKTEGGATTAGTTTTSPGGANAGGASEGGTAGAGGDSGILPDDCLSCLQVQCAQELDDCLNDDACGDPTTGQYAAVFGCIENARADGLVKRDGVRGCGFTMGESPDPNTADVWAPPQMVDATTNLMNCMATSHAVTPSADWADPSNPASFTDSNGTLTPAPWPADSCAKLSCTSAK